MDRKYKRWTDEDIDFLVKNYGKMHMEVIAKHLGRTVGAVRHRANKIGLKRRLYWTKREIEILMREYGKVPTKEIAKKLGRSCRAVRAKANRLGLRIKVTTKYDGWSKKEIIYLIENYYKLTTETLANQLGRTKNDVYSMANKLGLTHVPPALRGVVVKYLLQRWLDENGVDN